jgi:hypothetical protein
MPRTNPNLLSSSLFSRSGKQASTSLPGKMARMKILLAVDDSTFSDTAILAGSSRCAIHDCSSGS